MMLAGVPVFADAVAELSDAVRATGADELVDRLERAVADVLTRGSDRRMAPRAGSRSFRH